VENLNQAPASHLPQAEEEHAVNPDPGIGLAPNAVTMYSRVGPTVAVERQGTVVVAVVVLVAEECDPETGAVPRVRTMSLLPGIVVAVEKENPKMRRRPSWKGREEVRR